MEDILASIRRILNEDEPGAAPTPPAGQASEPGEPLALTEDMMVAAAKPAAAAKTAADKPVAAAPKAQ
jgi:cell pole-organizing protein PopZ